MRAGNQGLGGIVSQPVWARDAVWYQIFPERFRNGDASNDPVPSSMNGTWPYSVPKDWKVSPWTSDWYRLQPWEESTREGFYVHAQRRRYGGDLQGVLDRLDYLQRLGVNALYLTPIFDSASLHKYGASSYHHIDRHFGPDPKGDLRIMASEDPSNPATWKWTSADRLFLELIQSVHRRGMRIIIDGVFNHVGIPFWAFQRAKNEGPSSPLTSWFTIHRWDDPATPADEFAYHGWSGVLDLPELARTKDNLVPSVREHLKSIVHRWMDPNGDGDPSDGIDGWRLDVAAEVPMGFWEEFRGWIKEINPESYLTGEIWWENYQQNQFRDARPWLDRAFDGVMNYRWGDAVFQFLVQPGGISASEFGRRLSEIHRDYRYDRCLGLQNLYDSHDTARLGSALVNPQCRQDHGASVSEFHEYDVRKPNATEKKLWKQLVAFQFLSPGAPMIYYGDEVGMWGADDPDCRKPMVWADRLYEVEQAHPFGKKRSVDKVTVDRDMLKHYQAWIQRRREIPALTRGDFQSVLTDDSKRLFAFQRTWGNSAVIAIFNGGDRKVPIRVSELPIADPSEWRIHGRRVGRTVSVKAHDDVVLEKGISRR